MIANFMKTAPLATLLMLAFSGSVSAGNLNDSGWGYASHRSGVIGLSGPRSIWSMAGYDTPAPGIQALRDFAAPAAKIIHIRGDAAYEIDASGLFETAGPCGRKNSICIIGGR